MDSTTLLLLSAVFIMWVMSRHGKRAIHTYLFGETITISELSKVLSEVHNPRVVSRICSRDQRHFQIQSASVTVMYYVISNSVSIELVHVHKPGRSSLLLELTNGVVSRMKVSGIDQSYPNLTQADCASTRDFMVKLRTLCAQSKGSRT